MRKNGAGAEQIDAAAALAIALPSRAMEATADRVALVTGATGFIGSHLTNGLLAKGFHVRALVRNAKAGTALTAKGVEVIAADLDDASTLTNVGDGVDSVFHCAAQLNLNLPNATDADFRTNLGGTEKLAVALEGKKIRAFVHVSSLAAIGIRPVGTIDETFREDPDLAYGKSKLAADRYLLERHRSHGLPVVILRPPTVYGPGEKYNFLSMCQAIRSGQFVLIGKGNNRIDFCAVENLVDAMIRAGERGHVGETYLIADSPALPFRETVATLWRALRGKRMPNVHLPVPIAYAAAYPLEMLGKKLGRAVPLYPTRVRTMSSDMAFDIGKARRELGYDPKGPFAEIVQPTLDWYRREKLVAPPAA